MNQENYMKIAGIFNKQMEMRDTMDKIGRLDILRIAEGLADYFEEESDLKCCCEIPHIHKCKKEKIFNRHQFLKLCGVSE